MYVLITYDVGKQRVAAVCKFLRCYLRWVQRSVFEGTLRPAQLATVIAALEQLIEPDRDSVYIYSVRHWILRRQVIGRCWDEGAPLSTSTATVTTRVL